MDRQVWIGLALATLTIVGGIGVYAVAAGGDNSAVPGGCGAQMPACGMGSAQMAPMAHEDHGVATPAANTSQPTLAEVAGAQGPKLATALTALDAAKHALAVADTKAASTALDEAKTAISAVKDELAKYASQVVNTRCPIMGGAVDPAKLTDALIRDFKGQKVGFCCGGCPAAWDKLSDAEKEKKLAAVTKPAAAPAAPAASPAGHMGHMHGM